MMYSNFLYAIPVGQISTIKQIFRVKPSGVYFMARSIKCIYGLQYVNFWVNLGLPRIKLIKIIKKICVLQSFNTCAKVEI